MHRNLILCLALLISSASFFSCSKERSSETGAFTTAKGSLKDNLGDCYTSTVAGSYYKGVALTAAQYLELQVNVTTAGNYTISSDTTNGFYFKDSGVFSSPGLKTIKLLATGTPLLDQNTSFLVSFGGTICTFTVLVDDKSGGTGSINDSDSAWQFKEGTKFYHGFINIAVTEDTSVLGQTFRILQIQGATAATADSVFIMGLQFQGAITPGSYISTGAAFFKFLGSYDDKDSLYSATFQTPTVTTTVQIISYDATTKIIKGTFAGTAKNKQGATVNITGGKFAAKLD